MSADGLTLKIAKEETGTRLSALWLQETLLPGVPPPNTIHYARILTEPQREMRTTYIMACGRQLIYSHLRRWHFPYNALASELFCPACYKAATHDWALEELRAPDVTLNGLVSTANGRYTTADLALQSSVPIQITVRPPQPSILFDSGIRYVKSSCGHWGVFGNRCSPCEDHDGKIAQDRRLGRDHDLLEAFTADQGYHRHAGLPLSPSEIYRWLRDYYAIEQEDSSS